LITRRLLALELDFVAHRRASPWVGRALLAVAIMVLVDAALQFRMLTTVIAQEREQLAQLGPRGARAAKPASAEEVAAARETVQRLSLPWASLFSAIESAASDQVALTAIEPDARNGTVKITGDSKDYLATLTYVLNLSRADGLSSVQLLRHETRQGDRAVAFTISAAWSGARS
jgi:hypothetical protein